ncbi:MAG: sigma 54-interacting transcriptional regulator [Planctomycetaceae bacterium]|nr:sigma 54-interacting transcriptional regulator [Planctomycetaceae bacterium]
MQEVFRRLRLAAQSEVTVFISGESGTGKELAAGAIHSVSSRRDGPFIAVNCSAIPETLLESELFGHVKGAFTGAVRDKIGVFEAAEGGTLFLDEIGDVSPLLQLKLLRVLQEREIRRVGDDGTTRVDVRLVTATNRDLRQLIQAGEFREDFYYRIHVFEIALPALRQRREDIPLLAEHFIHSLSKTRSAAVTGIARDALHQMLDYDWPGNVRELRNAIEHAFVTVQGDRVTLFDLPIEIREWGRRPAPHPVTVAYESTEPRTVQSKKKALPARKTQLSAKEREERQRIIDALEETGGNKTAAARQLGFSRVTMWKKTRRYGLSAGESESEEQPGRE